MGVIGNKIRHAALNKAQKNSSSFSKAKYLSSRRSTLPNQGMGASASTGGESSAVGSGLGEKLTGEIEIKFPLKIKVIFFVIIVVIFFMAAMILSIVLLFSEDEGYEQSLSIEGYYTSECETITVLFVDKYYNPTGSETYSPIDYIAGVVAAEVGGFNNIEVYKAFAIAARTYAEGNFTGCAIEASSRKQAFKDITAKETEDQKLIYQAVEETFGMYLLNKDGSLHSAQYDAFACIDVDDDFYTISQMNQKIPKTWIDARIDKSSESHKGWFNCSGKGNLVSHHGNGMSQYGALYLATTYSYNYSQILKFYYGENTVISSLSYISSIAGLEIKDTSHNSNQLNESLSHFLARKGSSISEYNEYIKINVEEAGKGTREGVVTAAVSLINFLYDNYKMTLPYYWGGKYARTGVNSGWGSFEKSNESRNGNYYYYKSFDCSGFVQWAIINGGFVDPGTGTGNFDSKFGGDSCLKSEPTCVGNLGDLINSADEHVVLIVGIDEKNQQYLIAESSNNGVVTRKIGMHSGEYSDYKILHLESFYSNVKNLS